MQITATEFKTNMGKYLALAGKQDIFITKNGRRVARLTSPSADRVAALDSLVGVARDFDATLDDIKKERLESK